MQRGDRQQQREPPSEPHREVPAARALVGHARGEAEAEQQREHREGFPGEDRHHCVEPAVRLGIEPVQLEPLDAVDHEQPQQREAAQGIDHVDAVIGRHPPCREAS
jgi:hypothetical protein